MLPGPGTLPPGRALGVVQLFRLAAEQTGERLRVLVREHLRRAALEEAVQVGDVAADGERRLAHVHAALPEQVADFLSYRVAFHRGASLGCRWLTAGGIAYSLSNAIVNDNLPAYRPPP